MINNNAPNVLNNNIVDNAIAIDLNDTDAFFHFDFNNPIIVFFSLCF